MALTPLQLVQENEIHIKISKIEASTVRSMTPVIFQLMCTICADTCICEMR